MGGMRNRRTGMQRRSNMVFSHTMIAQLRSFQITDIRGEIRYPEPLPFSLPATLRIQMTHSLSPCSTEAVQVSSLASVVWPGSLFLKAIQVADVTFELLEEQAGLLGSANLSLSSFAHASGVKRLLLFKNSRNIGLLEFLYIRT